MIIQIFSDSPTSSSENKLAKLLAIPCFVCCFTLTCDVDIGTDELDNGILVPHIKDVDIIAATIHYTDMDGENYSSFELTDKQLHLVHSVMTRSDERLIVNEIYKLYNKGNLK